MNYTKDVSEKIDLVNEVMDKINTPHLFENSDFSVDDMSLSSWVKINLNGKGQNKISLSLMFTQTSLEIRMDRIAEAIEWSSKDLRESKAIVMTMLENLFKSHILVEYYGSSRTRIRFFDQDGKCTNNFRYYEGFPFCKGKREDKLYFPIYPAGADL